MFRLKLKVESGKDGILKAKEMELDYPHSLLLYDNHTPNNLLYTIDTIRTKNVKGSYIITISKLLDIGGLDMNNLTTKYDDKTISTKKTKPIYLQTQTYKRFQMSYGRKNLDLHQISIPMIDDVESTQHIYLGRQILINGTKAMESKPNLRKKPFPTLLLEKRGVSFIMEYLDKQGDGSAFIIDNEEIEIYGTVYRN